MRTLPRMNDSSGRAALVRNKQFSISGPQDGVFRARAALQDNQHTMEVSLAVSAGDMEVLEVEGSITSAPQDICAQAVGNLRELVGMRIRPGLFREMEKRVGGAKGCIHINELIREACQLVVSQWNLTEFRRMQEKGLSEEEIIRWGEDKRSWTCTANPEPVPRP